MLFFNKFASILCLQHHKFTMFIRLCKSFGLSAIQTRSSAYIRWFTSKDGESAESDHGDGGRSSLTPKPDCSSSTVRPCTNIENIVGDKMSPCFTPRGHFKYSVASELFGDVSTILVWGSLYRDNNELYILPTTKNLLGSAVGRE